MESQLDCLTGSSGITKPEDVQVVMTSSAPSIEVSDGGGRIADTKRRQDSQEDRQTGRARSPADQSLRPPKQIDSFACFQLVSSNWTLQIDSVVLWVHSS